MSNITTQNLDNSFITNANIYTFDHINSLKYSKNNIFIYNNKHNVYNKYENNIEGLDIIIDNETVDDCLIIIDSSSKFNNTKIIVKNCYNAKIFINEKNKINNSLISISSGMKQICSIGNNNIIHGMTITLTDMHQVSIGNNSLLGAGLVIRAGQSHSYYDLNTKKFFNSKLSCVRIGNHVWTALNVMFTDKGSVNDNCIVGARSTITRNIEQTYSIIAGTPAKVIRSGVDWDNKTPLLTVTKLFCENNKLKFSWRYAEEALKEYSYMFN